MSSTRQPNRALNEPNRRRSASDSAVQIECGLRRHALPDWALSRSDYDVASCSSDDDHERIELDDREGYRNARREKLKVRRRWARTIGPGAYEVPRFCEELTEHVRSVRDGPLDADGIEEDEGFFAALTAPYESPSPSRGPKIDWARHPPSPIPASRLNECDPQVRRVGCPPGLCDCAAEQDVDNDHSSDDGEPIPHPDGDYETDNGLYTPSGKWKAAKNSPIDGWETLMRIKVTPPLSVMLRKGVIAGNPITYISRLWNTNNVPRWNGFFSELSLFASSRHLRPLQGTVVPHIINVYIEPGYVNVAMEPPHECFWIEASPDMPDALKHRCVEAFEKLHAQGILHGDAELRHMLIDADAKVTIIDFKAAATCVPLENVAMEEVGLRRAALEEFRLEMRRVKFKLDYDGAREKEREKQLWKKRGELKEEDVLDPPVESHVLDFHWLEGCERPPTRFVVPGQTKEQVGLAVKRFLRRVGEMDRQMGGRQSVVQELKSVSVARREEPGVPEVPAPSPPPKLMIKLPPLSALRSPLREIQGPAPLLPPLEIPHIGGTTLGVFGAFTKLPPLAAEEASLHPGPSTESQTEGKAITHPDESEFVSSVPGFVLLSPATVVKALPPVAVGNYDGDISLGLKDHDDTSQSTTLPTTPPSAQCSTGSTFPIMRTFADVARKAIQVFGRIAKQSPVQPTVIPSQQQKKSVDSVQRKRRLSESSASESDEYELRRQRKKLRQSSSSSLSSEGPSSLQPALGSVPRTWSLVTAGQSRKTKRKREPEGTAAKLVWDTEQQLRKKRCKLSELSSLSDASGSETEDETTGDRTTRLRRTLAESISNRSALTLIPPNTLSTARRDIVPQSDEEAPPIIIRDYAYISHNVPKAPYVPHPPTENRMAAERAKHICLSNAKACLDAGLPYPMTENQQGRIVPDLASSPYAFSAETFREKQERKQREKRVGLKQAEKVQRSFGNLKRKLDAQRAGASGEFEERLYAGWRDVGRRLKKKVTSRVRFSMENLRSDAQSPSGDTNSGVLCKVVRGAKGTHSILKQPPPIKVFNYQRPWDDGENGALSPKIGPEAERWDRSGGFGMLGVRVGETRTKTEEAFRAECALRAYEGQKTIESVDAEWREEEERMAEVRKRELESSDTGF